jgi:hypothetical protein
VLTTWGRGKGYATAGAVKFRVEGDGLQLVLQAQGQPNKSLDTRGARQNCIAVSLGRKKDEINKLAPHRMRWAVRRETQDENYLRE